MDFRRLLLIKCQDEFEKGTEAMMKVATREAKEQNNEGEHHWVAPRM